MVGYSLAKATALAYTAVMLCLLCSYLDLVAADNVTQPISIFRSVSAMPFPSDALRCANPTQRPDLVAPIVTIFERKPELVAPGYYFVSPYQQIQESVHIYDNDGVKTSANLTRLSTDICRTLFGLVSALLDLAYPTHLKYATTRTNHISVSTRALKWQGGAMDTASSWINTTVS